MQYDPDSPIDRAAWEALDEAGRIAAVSEYHLRQKIRLPNLTVHAIIHVIVENQVALKDEYAAESVLKRLMSEGLDRHEALHAIGSVVAEHIFNTLKHVDPAVDVRTRYLERLERLTSESWRKQVSKPDPPNS